jgi:hypothetical protein
LEEKEDKKRHVIEVPDGGQGYVEASKKEGSRSENEEGMGRNFEDVPEKETVEDEVGDTGGARLAVEFGFDRWKMGGVPGVRKGLGLVPRVDVFGDGESDGDPGDQHEDVGYDLAERAKDSCDEFWTGVGKDDV